MSGSLAEALGGDGMVRLPGLIDAAARAALVPLFDRIPHGRPGQRIDAAQIERLAAVARVRATVAPLIGGAARPVRALLFDKRAGGNWALGWHQDRTIKVAARHEVPGFGPWTVKDGRHHVAPPVALLAGMVTARLHLDAVDGDNAPLRVVPGSHRLGLVPEAAIDAAVATHGERVCLANPGDVWLYATLVLHASARALPGRRRRVLQLDFAGAPLPGGLAWAVD